MKKVIPFAFLMCALFSLSSFSPAKHNTSKTTQVHRLWWYPSSGVLVGATGGDANWTITPGSSGGPGAITFTRGTSSWGPYTFTAQGGNTYVAGGPRALGVIQSWVINDQVSFTTLW
ncbi:MAG TPA: hypothetical protein VJ720_13135, partial [Chitinophaga sp.]|nr:hypothetical protein [Chitinophaga sp.]